MYGNWLRLSVSTRHTLAHAFGIKKTNPTHVVDNVVKDDGYPISDVENKLSVEAMQKYTGSMETAEDALWRLTVDKAEGRVPVVPVSLGGNGTGAVVQVLSPQVMIEDNVTQTITVQAVNDAPKKKTTRAKPARRKGK